MQLLFIVVLAQRITHNKENTLGEVNINPINKKELQYRSKELKYFYEPLANSTQSSMDHHPLEIEYSINADSLHERYEYQIEKDPNTFRIITLGDSFTFGLFMKLEENWTEILEDKLNNPTLCKKLNKVEVINLGVYGYDIQYSVERYKLRGAKYNPDLVIWFIKADDVFQINELVLEKERYYDQQITESQRNEFISQGVFYPSWAMAMKDIYKTYEPRLLMEEQKKFLAEFDRIYTNKVMMIGLKNDVREVKDLLQGYISNSPNKYLFNGLPNAADHPEFYIPDDGHPNERGHTVIAEEVYTYMKKNSAKFCN